ncbi:MFS transporter [Cryptosporangium phraense]|uniref:MFS transporter n=1 Tax=Cryptosporangium phraense TaxID=2593070 RepID=A0A545AKV4_9ACTN|nr:MFS transporter [Cryptosporangium phraense]TQS41944.1 MFS transporter [Cryptosporangium phraense]
MASLTSSLRVGEFRALWGAELLSLAGDQLARVAVAVLVFGRTGSAGWAAFAYALTFLPAVVGGVVLSWPADRYRRRTVLVVADVVRAGLVAGMALPGVPLWVLCVLLTGVVLAGAPFTAAQGALLPEVLPGELYQRGLAVRQVTSQTVQLVGFGAGGLLAAASPSVALGADAATFGLSALILRLGLTDRPKPRPTTRASGNAAIAHVFADPRRRVLLLLAWNVGWFVVPEALAAPYAAALGSGPAAVGLLMAADPLGSVLGAWALVRFVPAPVRDRLIGPLAVAAGVPLILCLVAPGLPATLALWALSGSASTAYLLKTQATFVRATPDAERGRAIGFAASGLLAAQGVTVLAGGVLADLMSPPQAVAAAGGIGAACAAVGAVAWKRLS